MSRPANPFDPFGFFSSGPMAMMQVGLELMQAWQRALMPMLALPTRSLSRVDLMRPWQFAGFIPQVDARVTPAASNRNVTPPAMPVKLAAVDDRLAMEAELARKQGRTNPWLGCLQGVQVVYPETPVVADKAASDVPVLDAMVKKARAAKPKASATAVSAPAKKTAASKAAAKSTPVTASAGKQKAAAKAKATTRK
jgi:hypothetical protein